MEEIYKFRIEGCKQYKNKTECKLCDDGLSLSNGHCCREGQWFNNSQCVSYKAITPTLRCKKFLNGSLCADEGCLPDDSGNEQYVSNKKCCPVGKYFDLRQGKCGDIPVIVQPCNKKSEGVCLECQNTTDHYVSNGVCVSVDYYWDSEFQMAVAVSDPNSKFPRCKKVNNDICQECQTDYQKGSDNKISSQCCS